MLLCPRCQRANPGEAAFCHFDGVELRPAGGRDGAASRTRLPHEFVFPSGRRCRSFEELARGCQAEWDVARDLLRQGVFDKFLTAAGRMDLAKAAQEARRQADPDIALDTFLAGLPASAPQRPRLDLSPRRLDLGSLHVGESRQVRLTISNRGQGLLHGSLAVAEGHTWLRPADGGAGREYPIKTAAEQVVQLRVDTQGLQAPNRYAAKLTLITNGGIVEVPVRLDVAVRPFARPPFQDVASPREMAEQMRTQPRPAGPLLESGEVARWFASNGWTYPVQGPAARGVAAVQQFFEGMGLSKPPPVQVAEHEVYVRSTDGAAAHGQITLRTDARKWVYARAESAVPWLRIADPSVSGPQRAVIAFDADARGLQPNRVHEATVRIVANSGQRLAARVRVRVDPAHGPLAGRQTPVLLVGATVGLVLRLALAVPADLYARLGAAEPLAGMARGSFAAWLRSPLADPLFVRHFVLATWWVGAVAGAVLVGRRGSRKADALFGLAAGAVGGLAASATLACLLPGLDALPRLVWRALGFRGAGGAWLATPAWILLAAVSWAAYSALAAVVVQRAGGQEAIARAGGLLARICRVCGLGRLAGRFVSAEGGPKAREAERVVPRIT